VLVTIGKDQSKDGRFTARVDAGELPRLAALEVVVAALGQETPWRVLIQLLPELEAVAFDMKYCGRWREGLALREGLIRIAGVVETYREMYLKACDATDKLEEAVEEKRITAAEAAPKKKELEKEEWNLLAVMYGQMAKHMVKAPLRESECRLK